MQGTWVIWSHRIWKLGHFYGSVNNLCAKCKGILNNPDVAPPQKKKKKPKHFYAHCCSFYGSQQLDLSGKSFDNICTAWQKAVRRIFFNLPYRTQRKMLPYVVVCENIRDKLINRFKDFFDSLMSSSKAIVQLLGFNAVFNNSPIDLNRKFKIEGGRGCFCALYYTFALVIIIVPSLKDMILMY